MIEIVDFISAARKFVTDSRSEAIEVFDIYANEARFGYFLIESDLALIPQGAVIIDIGAGISLLSGYLAAIGFRVTALEPVSEDFSHIRELNSLIRRFCKEQELEIDYVYERIEEFTVKDKFDYAFSINVFEHIPNVETGLSCAYLSLKPGGCLRVYCPNYIFPYEPHFNIPTLVGKKITEICLARWIFRSSKMMDPRVCWKSLNWINVLKMRRIVEKHCSVKPEFNRYATYKNIRRVFEDPLFRDRRLRLLVALLELIRKCGLVSIFKYLPVIVSPVMDCKIVRPISQGPVQRGV